jgi:hypothetical protein
VTGEHGHLIAQRKKFLTDSFEQKIDIPTGQIPTTDAAGEKHVTADQQFVRSREEAEAAWTMTWHLEHLQLKPEKVSARGFRDREICRRRFDFQLKTEAAKEIAIGNHWDGFSAATDLATESLFYSGCVLHVIDVPVGEQKQFQIDPTSLEPVASAIGRIEKDVAIGCLEEIAVCFENTAAKTLVAHDWIYFRVGGAKSASDRDVFRDF